jgi:hypothetical protein
MSSICLFRDVAIIKSGKRRKRRAYSRLDGAKEV